MPTVTHVGEKGQGRTERLAERLGGMEGRAAGRAGRVCRGGGVWRMGGAVGSVGVAAQHILSQCWRDPSEHLTTLKLREGLCLSA